MINSPYGLSADARPSYKRFARGLHEILGLKYRDGSLWCAQRGELTRLTERGTAVVVVTHSAAVAQRADRVVELRDGVVR